MYVHFIVNVNIFTWDAYFGLVGSEISDLIIGFLVRFLMSNLCRYKMFVHTLKGSGHDVFINLFVVFFYMLTGSLHGNYIGLISKENECRITNFTLKIVCRFFCSLFLRFMFSRPITIHFQFCQSN